MDGARGRMPAILRPNVRSELCDVDVEVNATEEEVTKKGTKRKRAPRTKGPCEHGVKYRSRVQRVSARSSALYMQGVRWVSNLRARSSAL